MQLSLNLAKCILKLTMNSGLELIMHCQTDVGCLVCLVAVWVNHAVTQQRPESCSGRQGQETVLAMQTTSGTVQLSTAYTALVHSSRRACTALPTA